jgi:chemotaxis protein methyltransferase CheR
MPMLTTELLNKFQELVYQKSDLHFSERKQVFFERQLRKRACGHGIKDFGAYYLYLVQNPAELSGLVQDLTTNKTSFFRNPAQFRALKDNVLPEIIESRNREVMSSWGKPGGAQAAGTRHPAMRIRIWSAGCSTGEEVYSLAFTLLEALKFPRAWDAEVIGTDIKAEALSVARRGTYGKGSVREMEPYLAEKYMESRADGYYVKEPALRLVKFFESNVKELSQSRPCRLTLKPDKGREHTVLAAGCFDVIFCRNVMIYFDREGQQRLVNALFDCLRPGGYLFTGDSEPLHLFEHGFVRAADEALYYQKPFTGENKCLNP